MFASEAIERFTCTMEFPIYSLDMNIESISRTHLQELFGSFPSNEASGDKTHEADMSDEEYQILEQDGDGNLSDEDDY